ncbi:MAG: SWIM zinc finger family protein [Verrucomicrobiales bacterium]
MRWNYRPYVSVAQRHANAAREIRRMEKAGRKIEPLGELSHRLKIATSFWGRAWCDHLEALGDYENRLPRGRTYVRNGSVLHLSMETGRIESLVQGSELYEQTIRIDPLAAAKWKRIRSRCHGGIGSLIELLQGRISDEIMTVVTDPKEGLFPRPGEIHLECSCPDWAGLCKHLAAVLYGIGARLDQQPELLFELRGVDHGKLVDETVIGDALATSGDGGSRSTLDSSALGDVFGIDLDDDHVDVEEGRREPVVVEDGAPYAASSAEASVEFAPTSESVRALREAIGLTRAEFAEWVGVSAQSVKNWEERGGLLRLQSKSLTNLQVLHEGLESEPDGEY